MERITFGDKISSNGFPYNGLEPLKRLELGRYDMDLVEKFAKLGYFCLDGESFKKKLQDSSL